MGAKGRKIVRENVSRNENWRRNHLSGYSRDLLRRVFLAGERSHDWENPHCAGIRKSLQEIPSLEQGVAFQPPPRTSIEAGEGGRRKAEGEKDEK
jgi:hypothetical protein